MGIYTELVLACEISNDIPEKAINIIRWLIDAPNVDSTAIPEELLSARGTLSGDSAYFLGKAISIFKKNAYSPTYELTLRTSSKNYGEAYQKFLVWVSQYVVTDGFAGYMYVEESDSPTLIYFGDRKVSLKKIKSTENAMLPTDISRYNP